MNPTSLVAISICVGTPNTGTYANQTLFVAVEYYGGRIMISNDGYTWTLITHSLEVAKDWERVSSINISGITIFVATSYYLPTTTSVMTSYDGENWYLETTPNQSYRNS